MKNYKGFTLIELLVVIAIIGILASIVLASLGTAKSHSRDARRLSDIKSIQLALSLYYDANGGYPTKIYTSSPLVSAGYLSAVPFDPSVATACTTDGGTGCYSYVPLGSGVCDNVTNQPIGYHLGAVLENANDASLTSDADACPSSGSCTNKDTTSCNGYTDFYGTSAVTNDSTHTQCNSTPGTAEPGGTETCYDVTP